MVAPRVSAESSITTKLYLSAISLIEGQSQRLPIKFGAKIATELDKEQRKDKREGTKIGLDIAKELDQGGG